MTRVKTQPLRWHGGKSYLASWIHSLAPAPVTVDPANGYTHRNIVFAGGLGEFWNWEPVEGISEAVNDCKSDLTNLWRVLASPTLFPEFARYVQAIPFAENIWNAANELLPDSSAAVSQAVMFFVKYRQSRQGLGKCYATPTTRTRRGMNENVSAWLSAVDGLPECHERLRRVEIRNMDFAEFIETYDHPRALFYLDPPYMHATRKTTGEYGHNEMTDVAHATLLDQLADIEGRFLLSGYHSDLYDKFASECGWHVHELEIDNKASSKKNKPKQVEVIWTNYEPNTTEK